jgi:hypothetical protein
MVGPDSVGPDGLSDLQKESLNLRRELDRKFCDASDAEFEPETIREAHWWVQPRWVKFLTFLIGVPAGLVFMYEVKFGNFTAMDNRISDISFAALGFVALLQIFFVFRGYWRMDI